LCFLWGTNWIYICYVEESRPPLWSSGQSSWLQNQRPYQIFWEVVGLERTPLSLVRTIEELLGRKSSGSGLESRDYGGRDPSRRLRGTLYSQKSPTSDGRSFGTVRSRTHSTELVTTLFLNNCNCQNLKDSDGGVQNCWISGPYLPCLLWTMWLDHKYVLNVRDPPE
jgi:hypothetical protein